MRKSKHTDFFFKEFEVDDVGQEDALAFSSLGSSKNSFTVDMFSNALFSQFNTAGNNKYHNNILNL